MLLGIKKLSKRFKITIPGPLVVVGLGTLLSWAADLENRVCTFFLKIAL